MPIGCWSLASRVPISRLGQLARAACGSVLGLASTYRVLSFTFLGWLAALETYKFANNFSGLNPDARDVAITNSDKDGASLPSRLDPAQDAKENDLPNAGTHPDRHVKIEDALPDKSHEDSGLNNNDHPSTAVGSSTDPRILVEPLPSSPTSNAAAAGTSAAFKPGVQGDSLGASGALPNQVAMQLASKTAQTLDTIAPTVSSVVASGGGIDGSGNGDLNAGHVVTLTVNLSDAVTVAGGVPTLSLNNGGTASYTGGSGSNALTFSYTVGAGEDTGDLSVTSFNLNGSTVSDAATNDAVVAGAVTNPSGILQIDTIAPTVSSVVASGGGIDGSGNGNLNAGHVVTLTVNLSDAVTVAGGVPTLSLNNGGTASYTGGSGSNALTFSYTVGAGEDTGDLSVTSFNLNGSTVSDAATNDAVVAGAVTNPSGILQIDTIAPTVSSVVASGGGIDGSGNGNLNAGHVVTLTVNLSDAVTVAGGVPTLSLNNGGTASYTGGSGSNALTFSYTVGAGEDTGDLSVTSFNLNGSTVSDAATNDAVVAGAVTNPSGILQIDTIAPTVSSVVASGGGIDGSGNGNLNAGHVVTLTVNLSDAVTVAGGVPTLSLNNGGTASYTGGSGSNALTFSYTVGAGEDTGDLSVTSFNLNGSTVSDAATNDAVAAGAVTNPSGILQIDTIAPTAPTIVGITLGGSGGNHWVWSGAAEANSDIAVFDGSTQLGTVTTPGLGAWNYTTTGLITNSSVHIFAATASDAAGNTSGISAAWIEGSSGNDTFVFSSEALLTAPVAINGNGGADTISMNAAVTLNSGDFGNVSGVQTLQLTGASAITLGADSVTAGIMNVTTGSGVTSIEDSNGVALNVNATALTDNTALSLSGTAGFTVTGLQGDITATGVSGSLNVTTVAVASGLSIATGSGSTAITASAFTTGQTLTLIGGSAATVTLNGGASTGSLAAGTYTGNLTVTGGSGANTITAGNGTNTITGGGGADALTGGTGSDTFNFSSAANLGAATTIAGGAGNDTIQMTAAATLTDASFLHAASIETLGLTGASTITLGANAAGAGLVNVITGTGATSVTDSNGVTLNVEATALAQNTALTLAGSAAEVVTGLVGDVAAGSLTGALTVTTGDATDNGISITTGSAATSITDTFNTDTVTVTATALAQNTALTLAGSAAEVVTGLVGDIAAGSLAGALTVTTSNAADNGISITTGSAATSITASGASDVVTVTATALAQNTALTLAGSAAEVVTGLIGDIAGGSLTGALTVTTGDATDNSISITTGSAATSITAAFSTDTVTTNATALAQNTVLTLVGSAADVVTGLVGDIAAGSLTGALTITTGNAADNGISITTGSAATSITASGASDVVTVTATALGQNTALTLAGSAAEVVTGLIGDIAAGSLTGALTVTTGDAIDNGISITTGSAATSITDTFNTDTVTVTATALANNTALTLAGSAAEVVSGLIGNITAGALTGVLTVTTGDATDNTIAITTGSAATSITDSFNTDTVTVTATALAQNTVLTLAGSAAEVITGLVGDIAAGSLTGALTVTAGDAADNGISITTGSAATSITASGAGDTMTVECGGSGQQYGADAGGVCGRSGHWVDRGYRGRAR